MITSLGLTKSVWRGPNRRQFLALLALVAASVAAHAASAQTPSTVPDFRGQVMLIRNTITALNHGNISGNYTVLRDLATEQFRQRNTAGDLASTFATLRKAKM